MEVGVGRLEVEAKHPDAAGGRRVLTVPLGLWREETNAVVSEDVFKESPYDISKVVIYLRWPWMGPAPTLQWTS